MCVLHDLCTSGVVLDHQKVFYPDDGGSRFLRYTVRSSSITNYLPLYLRRQETLIRNMAIIRNNEVICDEIKISGI
jgi:hypothetical protein